MKTYSIRYKDKKTLKKFIELNKIPNDKNVWVQVFVGIAKYDYIKNLLNILNIFLDKTCIIGTTTDGEIYNASVTLNSTIMVFTIFEKSAISSACATRYQTGCKHLGMDMANRLASDNLKAIVTFTAGLDMDGEDYLNGISKILPKVKVAGGMAGDNAHFKKTFVFDNKNIVSDGAVGVGLYGNNLKIFTDYSFNWVGIGKKLKITKSRNNRVYTIDNIKAREVYRKYLGDEVADALPATGIEFPLIIDKNGVNVARAVIDVKRDGSLIFAGNVAEGSIVRFGIGDSALILNSSKKKYLSFKNINIESIFIYSCMARRRFLQESIELELSPFKNIAPTNGFFTYGEFFTKEKKELLNQTMTILALSENETISYAKKPVYSNEEEKSHTDDKAKTLLALSHLINVATNEIEEINAGLEKKVSDAVTEVRKKERLIREAQERESIKIKQSYETFKTLFDSTMEAIVLSDEDGNIVDINQSCVKILGYKDKNEFMGKNIIEFIPKHFIPIVVKKIKMEIVDPYEISIIHKEGHLVPVLTSSRNIYINNKTMRLTLFLDLTELKKKEELLQQQSRLAQMGEMISMIAHQWRQPLSAINSSIISIDLKLLTGKFDLSKKVDRDRFLDFLTGQHQHVKEYVRSLSDTIDDFRNFFRPNKQKETVCINEPVKKALKIVSASMSSKNIEIRMKFGSQSEISIYQNEIMQVILNILKNAEDNFIEKKSTNAKVEIVTKEDERYVTVIISDNGGGIPQEILPNIFDPYFSTKSEKNGTGLGLYMSKVIIEDHHRGSLEAYNSKEGVKFIIKIPLS